MMDPTRSPQIPGRNFGGVLSRDLKGLITTPEKSSKGRACITKPEKSPNERRERSEGETRVASETPYNAVVCACNVKP